MDNSQANKTTSTIKKLSIFIISFLIFNTFLAVFMGDISLRFLVPEFSFKGLSHFLAYLGYSDISLYIGLNSLLFGVFWGFYFESIFYIILGLIFSLFFCINNALYSNYSNEEKIELYNFLLENNIHSHRICQRNTQAILFANIYKNYSTQDLCQKETSLFINNQNTIKNYFDLVTQPKKFKHAETSRRSAYIDNGIFDDVLKSVCVENCYFYRQKNYNDLLNYLRSTTSSADSDQFTYWNTFNKELLSQFSSIKIDIKKEEIYLPPVVQDVDGKFKLHLNVYLENPKTLERNIFFNQNITEKDINVYGNYYFINAEYTFIPITEEMYKTIKQNLKNVYSLNLENNKKLK